MPPGVSESMIPGNRPEDIWIESATEQVGDLIAEHYDALEPLGPKNLAYLTGKFFEVLDTAMGAAFSAGVREGQMDRAEEELDEPS